jgi:hypothetical protein
VIEQGGFAQLLSTGVISTSGSQQWVKGSGSWPRNVAFASDSRHFAALQRTAASCHVQTHEPYAIADYQIGKGE